MGKATREEKFQLFRDCVVNPLQDILHENHHLCDVKDVGKVLGEQKVALMARYKSVLSFWEGEADGIFTSKL